VLFSEKPLSRAYNIGLGKTYDSEGLRQAIKRALPDLSFEIGKHPNAEEVGPHRNRDVLDITLAKQELGWAPRIDLEEGIARLGAWLMQHKHLLQ
jgi:nucleoside-diphosphate-sugar epimerase